MDCEAAKNDLGRYLDEELSPTARAAVEAHVTSCDACVAELETLRSMAAELASDSSVRVPAKLWDSIERTLDQQGRAVSPRSKFAALRQPLAMAASVLFVIGVGLTALLWTDGGATRAEAATVDFGVLLDELPLDPGKAFRKFLVMYQAKSASPVEAKQHAPELNFEIPDELPGGFRLRSVYALQFHGDPGVAAEYDRGGEFLGTIFHRPVQQEDFGTHKDYACVIGQHHGHKVEVGSWKLIHITDPTTCHCILSQLSEQADLPAVIGAIVGE